MVSAPETSAAIYGERGKKSDSLVPGQRPGQKLSLDGIFPEIGFVVVEICLEIVVPSLINRISEYVTYKRQEQRRFMANRAIYDRAIGRGIFLYQDMPRCNSIAD